MSSIIWKGDTLWKSLRIFRLTNDIFFWRYFWLLFCSGNNAACSVHGLFHYHDEPLHTGKRKNSWQVWGNERLSCQHLFVQFSDMVDESMASQLQTFSMFTGKETISAPMTAQKLAGAFGLDHWWNLPDYCKGLSVCNNTDFFRGTLHIAWSFCLRR